MTAALTAGGVAAKDVQTSDLSINPQYNPKGVITGYEVTNTLTAVLRNFTTAGSTVDAIAGAAGNATRIDSLNFSVEDTRGLEDQARTDAVHQAVSHARSMARRRGSASDRSAPSPTRPRPSTPTATSATQGSGGRGRTRRRRPPCPSSPGPSRRRTR